MISMTMTQFSLLPSPLDPSLLLNRTRPLDYLDHLFSPRQTSRPPSPLPSFFPGFSVEPILSLLLFLFTITVTVTITGAYDRPSFLFGHKAAIEHRRSVGGDFFIRLCLSQTQTILFITLSNNVVSTLHVTSLSLSPPSDVSVSVFSFVIVVVVVLMLMLECFLFCGF